MSSPLAFVPDVQSVNCPVEAIEHRTGGDSVLVVVEASDDSTKWENAFHALQRYLAAHGTYPVKGCAQGPGLSEWMSAQRHAYRRGNLSAEKAQRLKSLLGWTWDPYEDQWEAAFAALVRYLDRHAKVPAYTVINTDGIGLGAWVHTQRQLHSRGQLRPDRALRLNQLDAWTWDPFQSSWERAYTALKDYLDTHGAPPPIRHVTASGLRLGQWASVQRTTYHAGNLGEERIKLLGQLEFWSWGSRLDGSWELGYTALCMYVSEHGQLPIARYVDSEGFRLGQWIGVQRKAYHAGRLSHERIECLLKVDGWVWKGRERRSSRAQTVAQRQISLAEQRCTATHADITFTKDTQI